MWRFIVSPEDADRMDLKEHIRELSDQWKAILGRGSSGLLSTTTIPTTRTHIC